MPHALADRLAALGYQYRPGPLEVMTFHAATRVGNLVFTSGQIPKHGEVEYRGKVGLDLDVATAQKAAEVCAFNCLRAAGAVADVETIRRPVKLLGMVNVAAGFDQTSEVINGATAFFRAVFGDRGAHARSAVGMVIPANWAVEVEAIFEVDD